MSPRSFPVGVALPGVLFLGALLAAGCGGSGEDLATLSSATGASATGISATGVNATSANANSSKATSGRLRIALDWPKATSRVIPTASQSVKVQILKGATVTNEAVLTPSSPTITFAEVPVGAVTVRATAYPTSAGTGTAMASAQVAKTIVAGAAAAIDLTMASTIDHLTVSPNPVNLALTGIVTRQATVTAYDAGGAVVLTSPTDLSYSAGATAVFIVSSTGLVTGLSVGTAILTATDAVSGKSVTGVVHVTIS